MPYWEFPNELPEIKGTAWADTLPMTAAEKKKAAAKKKNPIGFVPPKTVTVVKRRKVV